MRVPLVPTSLIAVGALAAGAALAPPASAAGWTPAPTVGLKVPAKPGLALADDGSAVLVTRTDVVRTKAAADERWTVHALPQVGSIGKALAVAAGPDGAVLVARGASKGQGMPTSIELDVRTAAGKAWRHLSLPSAQSYAANIAVARDPTGGWMLAHARRVGGPVELHVIAQHLDASGTPDSPEQDLGRSTLPSYDGAGTDGVVERTMQVDRTGRTVLATVEEAAAGTRQSAHVRPPGGTFGPAQAYGEQVDFFQTFGIRSTSAGRSAIAGNIPDGTVAATTAAAGVLPEALTTVQQPGGFANASDAAPIGDDLAAAIWTTDRQDDCGESGRECKGDGGALMSRVLGPAGLQEPVRVASRGTIAPVVSPLSGGKALLAWEQLGTRGATSTWHARLIGPTGTISSISAPAGTNAGSSGAQSASVVTAGRWAIAAWPKGTGTKSRMNVVLRRF